MVVQLTRGRAWIGVLSVLLTGIVALNVVSLSLGASQGKIAQQAQILEQENSALRARLAERLSNERVAAAAASLGMTAPGPADISYRRASGDSLRMAVRRLAAGFELGGSLVEAPVTTPSETPVVAATAPAPTVPAATEPAVPVTTTAPAAPAPAPAPATPAPTTTAGSSGGGVSAG